MKEEDLRKQQKKARAEERKRILEAERGRSSLFFLAEPDERELRSVKEINALLEGTGVELSIVTQQEGDYRLDFLKITIRENNLANIRTRSAGRLRQDILVDDGNIKVPATTAAVRKLIHELGPEKAAEKIGMSRAGMYKRLKASEKRGLEAGDSDPLF